MSGKETPTESGRETFVGTTAAEARITRLRKEPGAAARVEKILAEMAEADHAYANGLA